MNTQKEKKSLQKRKFRQKEPLLSYGTALFVEDFIGRKMSFVFASFKVCLSVFKFFVQVLFRRTITAVFSFFVDEQRNRGNKGKQGFQYTTNIK